MSPRELFLWAEATIGLAPLANEGQSPIRLGFEAAYVLKQPRECREGIRQLANAHLP
jgi:hypothetical protein